MEANETLFLIKGRDEYCFLYSDRDPGGLFGALLEYAESDGIGLSADDALEVIEEVVADNLHRL